MLERSLCQYTPCVRRGVHYNLQGTSGELDVVALLGNVLFVCECKNSLLPCSSFEARTTFDHLLKGGEQLGRFEASFAGGTFRTHLEQRLGWALPPDVRLTTCIVTANRMFGGYRIDGHAIRSCFELASFLNRGWFTLSGERLKMWEAERFAPSDLVRYLAGEVFYEPAFRSMSPISERYVFGEITLLLDTFVLDAVKMHAEFGIPIPKRAAQP
jgi:hypothetical protein